MQRIIPASLFLLLVSSSALAVPMQVQHQGRLMSTTGAPLAGANDLTLSIYDDPASGTLLWTETQTVDFDNGYFSVTLGADSGNAITDAVFDGDERYLGVTVNAGAELVRNPIVSTPYAIRAGTAAQIEVGGTTIVDSSGVIDASEIRIGGTTVIDGSGVFTGTDTLTGLGCSDGQLTAFVGSAWSCIDIGTGLALSAGTLAADETELAGMLDSHYLAASYTPTWTDVSSRPAGLDDGDDDTLGALTSCSDGQGLVWDASGAAWVCGDSFSGDMGGGALTNVDWPSSDRPFTWASLDMANGNYRTADGTLDPAASWTPGTVDSTSCTDNNSACIRNVGGNYFMIGIEVPSDATRIDWGPESDEMCWPVPLGDQDPLNGGSWDSGIDAFSMDDAGNEVGHCVQGAPSDTERRYACLLTVGADSTSDTDYGIVCLK